MPIADAEVPRAQVPLVQHVLDTYASEINKTLSVWRAFGDADLEYRPHPRSASVGDIFGHELLSGRRFFGAFLGATEAAADAVLPPQRTAADFVARLEAQGRGRLPFMAAQGEEWWLTRVPFFDVERERIWIVWRRILHSAHHRTQLAVYLRLLDRRVPAIYGPTADVTWTGADPTQSIDAAGRP